MKKLSLITVWFAAVLVACSKEQLPQPIPATNTSASLMTTVPNVSTSGSAIMISPVSVTHLSVATITGANFGTSIKDVTVLFGGGKDTATVQSVTQTEIKVIVPVTTGGPAIVKIKNTPDITTPSFFYRTNFIDDPYVSGAVWLPSQAAINTFIATNKGRQLDISGLFQISNSDPSSPVISLAGLSIIKSVAGQISLSNINTADAPFLDSLKSVDNISVSGCAFKSLKFGQLQSLPTTLTLRDLNNLKDIDIKMASSTSTIDITNCAQFSKMEFHSLSTANTITISACPQLSNLDGLQSLIYAGNMTINDTGISVMTLRNLTSVGVFSAGVNTNLSGIEFPLLSKAASLSFPSNQSLTKLSFPVLSNITGSLILSFTGIKDLSGFDNLQSVGSLLLNNNLKLVSLNGLQNIKTVTQYGSFTNNTALTSLCPLKDVMIKLSQSTYTYYTGSPFFSDLTGTTNLTKEQRPALIFTNNGVADPLAAVATCP